MKGNITAGAFTKAFVGYVGGDSAARAAVQHLLAKSNPYSPKAVAARIDVAVKANAERLGLKEGVLKGILTLHCMGIQLGRDLATSNPEETEALLDFARGQFIAFAASHGIAPEDHEDVWNATSDIAFGILGLGADGNDLSGSPVQPGDDLADFMDFLNTLPDGVDEDDLEDDRPTLQ